MVKLLAFTTTIQIACVWQTWSLWVSRFETVQNVWWGLFLSIWILRENLCELLSSYFSFPGPKWGHTGQLRIALGQKLNWGGESERKKIESHDEDDGPNSGFSSQASISSLRLGVFLPFFHGCRNTSLIKVFSLLIEDNRLMRSACRSYKNSTAAAKCVSIIWKKHKLLHNTSLLVLLWTWFVGLEFRIFGGFG